MIDLLTLENFKAFGSKTRIEMSKITLIFGQNSAGKSSILQSLNLLKQTQEQSFLEAPLLPKAESGIVDLGSFKEFIFDHDTSKSMSIGFSMSRNERASRGPLFGMDAGIELCFRLSEKTGDISISKIDLLDQNLEESIATFKVQKETQKERTERIKHEGQLPFSAPSDFKATCTSISKSSSFWVDFHSHWSGMREEILEELRNIRDFTDKEYQITKRALDDHNTSSNDKVEGTPKSKRLFSEDRIKELKDSHISMMRNLEDAINFYSRDFSLEDLINRFEEWSKGQRGDVRGFAIRSRGIRDIDMLPELEGMHPRFYGSRRRGFEAPRYRSQRSRKYFDVLLLASSLSNDLSSNLQSLFPLGPFRRPPERWYFFSGTSPRDVGYKGDQLPDLLYRRPELRDQANEWLARLDIGYQLSTRPIGDKDSDLFEVRLLDTRRGSDVEVALTDVGFGISQILPFIVQSLASDNRIISIEQPEVHIHPKLQAELGDLICHAIEKPFNHQFLIETHSEHLVLRIQRLIREKQLSASDVSVLYVSRGEDGSTVSRLRLNEAGDFIDPWPGGFFPERLRELGY